MVKNRYQTTDLLCGTTLHNHIMSPSNRLKLEFRGIHSGDGFRGFKLEYSFLTSNKIFPEFFFWI